MHSGKKLRLLHVVHLADPAAGGAVSATQSMCAALADRGHDVTLFATDKTPHNEMGSYRARAFAMEFPPLAVSTGLARAMRSMRDVDLVHIHQLYRFPQSWAAWFSRRHGIPYCIQPHGSLEPMLYHKRERRGFKRLYETLIENRNLQNASGLIYTAQGERDAADFLRLRPPTFVVPLGIDMPDASQGDDGTEFRARHGLGGRQIIAWMGRIVQVKGLDIFVRAFAAIAQQNRQVTLVLIGPDTENYGAGLRQLIAELGITDRVIFTGMLKGDEKLEALRAADLFVMPSFTENFALAAVEAMALARPVIVSSGVKIAPEILAAGAGLVVAPQAGELEAAMCRLLHDVEAREQMGAAARRLALRFNWSAVVCQLEDAYAAMIAGFTS
jgi:glycosyltransferase involved in cell wall biosynthesis